MPFHFAKRVPCASIFFSFTFSEADEDISPDSDQYPSLDSGNSTIHSDDGCKIYSPHVGSVNGNFNSKLNPSFRKWVGFD